MPPDTVPADRFPAPSPYADEMSSAAAAALFTWPGTFADGKGKLYRLRYDFFRSPTGDVLALVGTGTMASITMRTTWLYTLLADGRCLVTFDSPAGGQVDLTGITQESLVEHRGFNGLPAAHRARVADAGPVRPFSDTDPLRDLRAFRQGRTERLAALGYAAFLDGGRNVWRYSVKGALALAFRQYFKGLRRAYVPDKVRTADRSLW